MSTDVTTEVNSVSTVSISQQVADLANGKTKVWSSIDAVDQASKLEIFNAISSAESISDNLGKPIDLVDFVVQVVTIEDEVSKEARDVPRVILIDTKGKAYAAVSEGVFSAIQNLMGIVGHPNDWESPLKVKVVEEKSRKGFRYMTVVTVK